VGLPLAGAGRSGGPRLRRPGQPGRSHKPGSLARGGSFQRFAGEVSSKVKTLRSWPSPPRSLVAARAASSASTIRCSPSISTSPRRPGCSKSGGLPPGQTEPIPPIRGIQRGQPRRSHGRPRKPPADLRRLGCAGFSRATAEVCGIGRLDPLTPRPLSPNGGEGRVSLSFPCPRPFGGEGGPGKQCFPSRRVRGSGVTYYAGLNRGFPSGVNHAQH
jgi:hypothetical protein